MVIGAETVCKPPFEAGRQHSRGGYVRERDPPPPAVAWVVFMLVFVFQGVTFSTRENIDKHYPCGYTKCWDENIS